MTQVRGRETRDKKNCSYHTEVRVYMHQKKKMKRNVLKANLDKDELTIRDSNCAKSVHDKATICSNKRRAQHKGTRFHNEKPALQLKGTFVLCDSKGVESQVDASLARALVAQLKACALQKDLHRGNSIYRDIMRTDLLKTNVFVGNAVVSMYAKCGAFEKAQEVFKKLPLQSTISWTALIAGYVQCGHAEEALNRFEQMQCAGIPPDAVTFTCALKACGSIGAFSKGEEIRSQIVEQRLLGEHIVLCNALIDMYAKCGALAKAQVLFDELSIRNDATWNALISGYSKHGHGEQALYCFEQMQVKGFSPNAITFTCILKACGSIGALDKGKDVHTQIKRGNLLGRDVVLASALIDMYAKCGALETAQQVFDKLSVRDVVMWNALIGGYAQHGHGKKALNCFEQMQSLGFSLDSVTFVSILQACGSIGALEKGQEIHSQIVRGRMLGKDVKVSSALIDMYVKCGALNIAEEVFDELTVWDVVIWNTLIAGYVQHGHSEEALSCFGCMQGRGFSPDAVTFACILTACGNLEAISKGEEVHEQVMKEGLLDKHVVVANALVYMYAKSGALEKAKELLDDLLVRDTVSWTSLITGYVQHECGEDALSCFERMQRDGFSPDALTFTCVLKACGILGAAYKGQILHLEVVKLGISEEDMVLVTVLVAMYANCGMLREAEQLYGKSLVWDLALWSVIMVGYAQLGRHTVVFHLFDKMMREDIKPDSTTFNIVLNTCSHCGLVDEGQVYFETISRTYGIDPTLEHHSCLVDLFGRADCLDKAAVVIEEMPHFANLTVWLTLLGACQKWGDMRLGTCAFEHAVELDGRHSAAYVCMSNIYAVVGRQEDAREIIDLMEFSE